MSWHLGEGLADRGALVTGAASGIGRASARFLAAAGARVVALDRDGDALATTVAQLPGGDHHALTYDLHDIGGLESVVDEVTRRLGDIYVLAHVAAALRRQPLDDVSEEDWDQQLDVNLKASFFLNRATGRHMIARRTRGRIINFTSGSWLIGPASGSHAYTASKGGIVSMSYGFARAYAPYGILVNAISPGQIDTPMQHDDNPRDVVEGAARACPLGRMGHPDEVAAAVVFLASDHASYMTGATLNVSGAAILY